MSRGPKGENNGTHSVLRLHIMKNSRNDRNGRDHPTVLSSKWLNKEVDTRRVGIPKPRKESG